MPLAAVIHHWLDGWADVIPGRGPGTTETLPYGSRSRTVDTGRAEAVCLADTTTARAGTTRTLRNRSGTRTF